jgi:hypothetical protein
VSRCCERGHVNADWGAAQSVLPRVASARSGGDPAKARAGGLSPRPNPATACAGCRTSA